MGDLAAQLKDLSKSNLGKLQNESAAKKYEKAAGVKEYIKEKHATLEPEPPTRKGGKRKLDAADDEDAPLSRSQASILTTAFGKSAKTEGANAKQQESDRLNAIRKYSLYYKYVDNAKLPPRAKGEANWSAKEASFHLDNLRHHLDSSNRPPVARKLFFGAVQLAEHFTMNVNNPLDLDLEGMTDVLQQNETQLETELSEMEAELSFLDISTPWYARLLFKTCQFAALYSEQNKQRKLQSELQQQA